MEQKTDVIGSIIKARQEMDLPQHSCPMGGSCAAQRDRLPDRKAIVNIISDVQTFMFPAFSGAENPPMRMLLEKIRWELARQIRRAVCFDGHCGLDAESIADEFLVEIPEIYRQLKTDLDAIYEGDPAAKSREEIIVCYPGFFAMVVHRIAHVLYRKQVPIVPRIMSEFVHQKTGIDIHPGATIGDYFCIDHGTGIVIGETTVIGEHVKLYQGVTLGAKSFALDENGNPVKDIKRHPNIGNNVVIYANATILGGDTYVGDNCTIGGNVWLTTSVEPGKTVYYRGQ